MSQSAVFQPGRPRGSPALARMAADLEDIDEVRREVQGQ